MGMAASQARYLGLAARKTNAEYQGQQINQARTALGNQSADLWNQMLGMSVPVAPNTEDFVTTQYSFSDGQNAFEITSMVPSDEEEGYNYTVTYRYFEKEIKGIENTNTNPQVQLSDCTVVTNDSQTLTYVAEAGGVPAHFTTNVSGTAETLTEITDTDKLAAAKNELETAGVTVGSSDKIYTTPSGAYYVGTLSGTSDITNADVYTDLDASYKVGNTKVSVADKTDVNVKASIEKIAEDNPNTNIAEAIANGEDIYTFVKNGTTYYVCKEDLAHSFNTTDATGVTSPIDKQAPMKQYYTSQVEVEKTQSDYALMDDASGTGRYSSIKLKNYNTTFNLNTESTTNEEAYNQAMNQYYYDTQQYDKKLADINAKTSIIHEQDRTLELRLKQLDTEHNALQTEMEAVKKVMDKNVEDTFKTFNG